MKIIVRPHETELIKEEVVNKGEYNVQQILFDFSEEYKTLNKRIIFTIVKTNESFEGLLVEDKCNIPFEVTQDIGSIYIGVCGYKTKENSTELDIRYSPKGCFFAVEDGSYRPAKESEIPSADLIEQYEERLNKSLNAINKKIKEVENQGNYAQEQGNYAKEQGNNIIESNKEAEKIIKDFEGNVNSSTILFNKNVLEKTNEFDNHVNEATETFDNHVTEKTNEFDENVDSIKEKLDDLYNNQIVGVAEGNSIYLEDSAEAKLKSIEIEGNLKQNSTKGYTMETTQNYNAEFGGVTMSSETENIFILDGIPTTGINKQYPEMVGKEYILPVGDYYLHYEYLSGEINGEYTGNILTVNIRGTGETIKNYISNNINNYKISKTVKVTLPENSTVNRVQFLINSSGNEYKNLKFREWWSKSENDVYEQFTENLPSPSPEHPQEINIIKNNVKLNISDNNNDEKSCVINLQDNFMGKIDNIKDTLKIENNNVLLNKYIRKVIHDENSFIECGHGNGTFQFKFLAQSGTSAIRLENANQYSRIKCNYATHWKNTWSDNGCFISYQGYPYLLVKDNEFGFNENMTNDEAIAFLKTLLAKTPIEFYYQMKDGAGNNHLETINLGEVQLPKNYKNVTNIYLDTNLETNMKIEYIKDTETVIKKLQEQIDIIKELLSTSKTSAFLLENYESELMEEF